MIFGLGFGVAKIIFLKLNEVLNVWNSTFRFLYSHIAFPTKEPARKSSRDRAGSFGCKNATVIWKK